MNDDKLLIQMLREVNDVLQAQIKSYFGGQGGLAVLQDGIRKLEKVVKCAKVVVSADINDWAIVELEKSLEELKTYEYWR